MLGELDQTNSSDVDMESRKRCLTSPDGMKKPGDNCLSRPTKKLKQARLPFATVTKPPVTQIPPVSPADRPSKKRKLSETDLTASSPITKLKDKGSVTPSIKTPSNKKTGTKATGKKNATIRAVRAPEVAPVVETEVSSSSEDPPAVTPTKSPCKKRPKPLERFLQSSQEPTSTSDGELTGKVEAVSEVDADPTSANVEATESEDGKEGKSSGEEPATTVPESNALSSADEAPTEEQSGKQDEIPVVIIEDSNDSVQSAEVKPEDDEASADESLLESSIASEANTSMESEASQPETTKPADSSVSSTPKSAPKPPKKTPSSAKSLQREKEREQKRLEKEKLKEEKRLKLEAEKEEKRKQKEAAKAEREAKLAEAKRLKEEKAAEAKRLKEQEKEDKLKEKQKKMEEEEKKRLEKKAEIEEKQRQKMKELEAKNEEKRKKEEERKKLDEEKEQKEALKRQVAEKQQNKFKSFFKKVDKPVAPKETEEKLCGGFVPFQLQHGMALAPVFGFDKLKTDEAKEEFNDKVKCQDSSNLYLQQLKSKSIKPGRRGKTVVQNDPKDIDEESIQIVDDTKEKQKTKTKAKLLQFHDNHRPAYYGTWTKTSNNISPRNFMKKDEDFLDYEFDSDDEWEEPGESLSDSEGEGESDADSDGGDSDNDGFFVEHGYLSESEDPMDEEETAEQWRARRKAKALAWEIELKRQTQVLKPIIIGCIWRINQCQNQSKYGQTKLESYKAVTLVDLPIKTMLSERKSPETVDNKGRSPTPNQSGDKPKGKSCKMPVPEEAMPDLLRLVHGNTMGVKSLIREFREFWRLKQLPTSSKPSTTTNLSSETSNDKDARSESPMPTPSSESPKPSPSTSSPTPSPSVKSIPIETDTPKSSPSGEITSTNSTPEEPEIEYTISKRQLEKKIPSIAVREKRADYPRICWYVNTQILEKYKMTDLRVPCEWQHITGPLATKRSESPLPGQNNVLPPQKVVSTPAASARRIVPTKVASPTSVISMLQQQKARQIASLSNQAALPGAAGLILVIANAAKEFVQSSTPFVSTNQPTAVPQQQTVQEPNVTVPTMPQITQHASVLTGQPSSEVTVSPKTKKVRTLESFFSGKKPATPKANDSKPSSTSLPKNVPTKVTIGDEKIEVAEVTTTTGNVVMETKQEDMDGVETSTQTANAAPQIAVLKDLLSKAKVNRIKQLSPQRQKSPPGQSKAKCDKMEENAKDMNAVDDDIIVLD